MSEIKIKSCKNISNYDALAAVRVFMIRNFKTNYQNKREIKIDTGVRPAYYVTVTELENNGGLCDGSFIVEKIKNKQTELKCQINQNG